MDIVQVFDEGFEDFSVVTEQERLTREIERATQLWLHQLQHNERLHGLEPVYGAATHTTAIEVIKHGLPFREEPYVLRLHVPKSGDDSYATNQALEHFCRRGKVHSIERLFGVRSFMLLTPLQSYSMDPVGRSEACTLRSAAACALAQAMQTMAEELPTSNKSVYPSCIPVFVPTFGPLDGFWSGVSCSESSHVFFQSERSLGSSTHDVDVRKTLQVLRKRLSIIDPAAAEFCILLEDELKWKASQVATRIGQRSRPPSEQNKEIFRKFAASVSTRFVYEAPVPWMTGFAPNYSDGTSSLTEDWDSQAPWQPWASLTDAVSSIQVECVWSSIALQNLARQKSVDAFSADAWHLRAYSPKRQQPPAFTGPFDAAADPDGPTYSLLQLSTGCAKASNAEQDVEKFGKTPETMRTFSWQLKRLLPLAIALANEPEWDAIETPEWWHERGLKRPRGPSETAIDAICQDVASGAPVTEFGLPESISATRFVGNLLAGFQQSAITSGTDVGQGTEQNCCDAPIPCFTQIGFDTSETPCEPRKEWLGTPSASSPMGMLSLHMLKLGCPYTIARLWRTFLSTVAKEHCNNLSQIGGQYSGACMYRLGRSETQPCQQQEQQQSQGATDKSDSLQTPSEDPKGPQSAPFAEMWMDQLNQHIIYMQTAHKAWNYACFESSEPFVLNEKSVAGSSDWMDSGLTAHGPPLGKCGNTLHGDLEGLNDGHEQDLNPSDMHDIVTSGTNQGAADDAPREVAENRSSSGEGSGQSSNGGFGLPAVLSAESPWRSWLQDQEPSRAHTRSEVHVEAVGTSVEQKSNSAVGAAASDAGHGGTVDISMDGAMSESSDRTIRRKTKPGPVGEGTEPYTSHQEQHQGSRKPTGEAGPSGSVREARWTQQTLQTFYDELKHLITVEEAKLRNVILCLRHLQPGPMLLSALLCCCQVALLAFESSTAGKHAVVRQAIHRCWNEGVEVSAKIWSIIGGREIDAKVQQRHMSGQPQLQLACNRLSRRRLRDMLQLLLKLVHSIEHVESLVAAGESLTRRLPGCPDLVKRMLDQALPQFVGTQTDASKLYSTSDAPVQGAQTDVNDTGERRRLSNIMQKHWQGVNKTIQEQKMYYSNTQGQKRGQRGHQLNSTMATPRLGWGDSFQKEVVLTCERNIPDIQGEEIPSPGVLKLSAHRVYVRKTGDVICAATRLVHGA